MRDHKNKGRWGNLRTGIRNDPNAWGDQGKSQRCTHRRAQITEPGNPRYNAKRLAVGDFIAIITDPDLLAAIEQLLAIKRAAGEAEHGSPLPIINAFIDSELSRLESVLPPVSRDTDYSILDRLLMDTVLAGVNI